MAAPAREAESMLAKVALECGGDISASQEEVLATSSFLGGDNPLPASPSASAYASDDEVFATPTDATQQQQDQEDDPVVTMCTLPFTPTPSKPSRSPVPPSSDADHAPLANPRRKPRVCIRKVRGGRISTPTPSPEREQQQDQPQAEQQAQAEQQQQPEQQPQPEPQPAHVDPLVRTVLMSIPTKTTTTTTSTNNPVEDFLVLCRQKGLI